MKEKLKYLTVTILCVMIFTSCADNEIVEQCVTGHTYGFWGGLWHGIIAPFDLIGMIFWDDVTVYAPNNTGGWYAFGFTLGVSALGFGGGKS